MGARGPKPKPTQLRILHGDRKDRINLDEPPAPDGAPQCPPGVAPAVREVWNYTVTQLLAMGCASTADRDALLCYCEAVVQHRRASEAVATSGVLVKGGNGTMMRNPALVAQRDAAMMIGKFAQLFGLSPSSRSEIRNPRSAASGATADRYLTG
jgi:P27 family predicted phage terminase small subunit